MIHINALLVESYLQSMKQTITMRVNYLSVFIIVGIFTHDWFDQVGSKREFAGSEIWEDEGVCGHGECVGIQNKLDSVALVGRVAL